MLFSGCGGNASREAPQPTPVSQQALAPGSTAPAGIDTALWGKLSAELQRVLAEQGTDKRTSAAATGKGSAVPDLSLRVQGGQQVYTWTYRQHGDYDLNGLVNAADLVQVGLHFGKSVLGSDWQTAQLADGDYNGQVTIADVAAIGQNFGGRVDGYELQKRENSAAPWTIATSKAFIPGDPQSGQYARYTHIGMQQLVGPEFRVVPYTDAGGPRAYGTPSVLYDTKAPLDAHWYTARGDNTRDGCVGSAGPLDVAETWELPLGMGGFTAYFTEPAVDQYGTIYLGKANNAALDVPTTGDFYAVSPEGELLWTFHTKDGIAMGAATNHLGQVVIGDLSGVVYCLAPDGRQVWRKQLSGMCIFGSPLFEGTGVVYICTAVFSGGGFTSSTVYKLNPDGTVAWSRGLNKSTKASLLFDNNANVCALDEDGEFYCFDNAGNTVFNYVLPVTPADGLLAFGVASRNTVYSFAESGSAFRVNTFNNAVAASVNLGVEEPETSPSINNLGLIAIGSQDTGTQAMKLNYYLGGAEQWDIDVPGDFLSNISIDSANNMYFGTFLMSGITQVGNGISCVRPDQTNLWFYPTADYLPFYTVIAADNLLVSVCLRTATDGELKLVGIRGS